MGQPVILSQSDGRSFGKENPTAEAEQQTEQHKINSV